MPQIRTVALPLCVLTLCALAAGVTGCQRKTATATPDESRPTGAAAAQLWRIEVVDGGKAAPQDICADEAVRAGFARPTPELNGQACVQVGKAVEADGTYAVRCNIDSQQYRVGSVVKGDPQQDFTVEMSVAPQGRTGPNFEQVRHYRRLGACPNGWIIGNSAAPGASQVTNALSGAVRTMAAPAP